MSIDTRPTCVHCGVNMLYPGAKWCRVCQQDARDNHGVCKFCHKDLTAWSNCWHIRRQMDQALVRKQIPFMGGCPSCLEHSKMTVEMEIVELVVSERTTFMRMVCTVCHTRCETRYDMYRPPPMDMWMKNE